jgi:high-affinity Fe2+/Pb2+ permease
MTKNVFAVPVFFIVFRETLEVAIISSVLLAFLKQTLTGPSSDPVVYKKLVKQVRFPSPFQSLPQTRTQSPFLSTHFNNFEIRN